MKANVALMILSVAFGAAVLGAAITTKKFIEAHKVESSRRPMV
jgi:hypothetical protein